MNEIVIDTSAFMKLLLDESGSNRAADVASHANLLAPDYLLTESANVLWKKVRWQGMPAAEALGILDSIERYPLGLAPTNDLLAEALAIACELPHPLYDTLYLLLALKGGRTLMTADSQMREAAEGLGIRVGWVGAD